MKKKLIIGIIVSGVLFLVLGLNLKEKAIPEKVKASSVVTVGDFRLSVQNKWDSEANKNYAELNWDKIADLSQAGYKLNQSEDSTNWENVSLNYNKSIKVLNIYPTIPESNTLKEWMDGLELTDEFGQNLIQVTPIEHDRFDASPDSYLKNTQGEYQYDVIMFGSWDSNNGKDLSQSSITATKEFIKTGRGVLFGHDTLVVSKKGFSQFSDELGVTMDPQPGAPTDLRTGGTTITVTNDGYLMKYPFEFKNQQKLTIPAAHNGQFSSKKIGTNWIKFTEPLTLFSQSAWENADWMIPWYLRTNNNLAMIQTGHSKGESTVDERKIIANVLYNLAQVSLENHGVDYTVKDDQAPSLPEVSIRCGIGGENEKLNIKANAKDKGKKYFWNVDATKKSDEILKSDTVREEIISNIAGYFYEVTDTPTSTLKNTVENYKDEFGRIPKERYSIYVAPETDALNYETQTAFTIEENRQSERYIHILAVDRANNVSEVSSQKLSTVKQLVNYQIERTKDEAQLVDLTIDETLEGTTKSFELQIPKNSEIKNFSDLELPTSWYSFENSPGDDYLSFSFATPENNSNAELENFIKNIRVTIKEPKNQSGNIKLILKEKVYTSWIGEDGKNHYYTFIPKVIYWNRAYNEAKQLTYRGLTGYLTTITTEEEHDFIYENIAKQPGWLGGTRIRTNENKMINDSLEISDNPDTFLIDVERASNWYWANGPETGTIIFTKPRRIDGGVAPEGIYDGFDKDEPNNSAGIEAVTQFAISGTKYWNDKEITHVTSQYNQGYYVEFSEYGTQIEKEEISESCWSEPIPQKVRLTAYDDKNNPLPEGDILYDQQIRLGQKKIVEPKIIPMYEFVKLINLDDTEHELAYTIGEAFREGKLIYANRLLTLHLRQIILDRNLEMVSPKAGYGVLISLDDSSLEQEKFSVEMKSSEDEALVFDDYRIKTNDLQKYFTYEPTVPMYYDLAGYVVTADATVPHNSSDLTEGPIRLPISEVSEYWITVYLKANGKNVSLYNWDYNANQLGEINRLGSK